MVGFFGLVFHPEPSEPVFSSQVLQSQAPDLPDLCPEVCELPFGHGS